MWSVCRGPLAWPAGLARELQPWEFIGQLMENSASSRLILAFSEWSFGRCQAFSWLALSSLGLLASSLPVRFSSASWNFVKRLHLRSYGKAHCGGSLCARYEQFPNYGGTWFGGCISTSLMAPHLRSALGRVQERVCVMVVIIEHLAL